VVVGERNGCKITRKMMTYGSKGDDKGGPELISGRGEGE
jgi:hypothetical protein